MTLDVRHRVSTNADQDHPRALQVISQPHCSWDLNKHTHANHDISDEAGRSSENNEDIIPTPKTFLDTEP